MNHDDPTARQSIAERGLERLVVPARAVYDPSKRIDYLHEPDLLLLWAAE